MQVLCWVGIPDQLLEVGHARGKDHVPHHNQTAVEVLLVPADPVLPLVAIRILGVEERSLYRVR
jgi:hypothetical protein